MLDAALVADYGRGALIRDFTFNRHNDLMLTGGTLVNVASGSSLRFE